MSDEATTQTPNVLADLLAQATAPAAEPTAVITEAATASPAAPSAVMALLHTVRDQSAHEAGTGPSVRVMDLFRQTTGFAASPRKYSTATREADAKKGIAMPDGSFPIPDVSALKDAIHAIGRAKNPEAVKAFIKKRARALGAEDLIPEDWK